MTEEVHTTVRKITDLAAAASSSEIADGVGHLVALSEAIWEEASRMAGMEITTLFSAYIEIEALIRWLQGCQQADWPDSKCAKGSVQRTMNKALAIFGPNLGKALKPYLEEDSRLSDDHEEEKVI